MKENGIYNEEVAENIQASFASAIGSSTGKNYSLCHGDLGLIDILMVAEKKLSLSGNDKSLQINSLKNNIIESLFSNKPVQADINSVGLLNGIASIGYGLLRIFDSELVPSVLILDKPKN